MAFTIRLLRQKKKKKFITTSLLDNDSSAILEFLVSLKVFLDYWCCCSCSCSCSCLCCCRYSCYSYCCYRWCYCCCCCCCWRRIGGNANTAMQLACPAAMLFEERNACRSATCRCCTALLLERYLQNCYFLVSFMTVWFPSMLAPRFLDLPWRYGWIAVGVGFFRFPTFVTCREKCRFLAVSSRTWLCIRTS